MPQVLLLTTTVAASAISIRCGLQRNQNARQGESPRHTRSHTSDQPLWAWANNHIDTLLPKSLLRLRSLGNPIPSEHWASKTLLRKRKRRKTRKYTAVSGLCLAIEVAEDISDASFSWITWNPPCYLHLPPPPSTELSPTNYYSPW